MSNLNEKAFESVERWRSRPLTRAYPYVYVDGIYLKRAWGGAYENMAVMVAKGVNDEEADEQDKRYGKDSPTHFEAADLAHALDEAVAPNDVVHHQGAACIDHDVNQCVRVFPSQLV